MGFQTFSSAYPSDTAGHYHAPRAFMTKWRGETQALGELLEVIPPGALILEVPIGTGRFLKLYHQRALKVAGRDISADMLEAARHQLEEIDELDELCRGGSGWHDCSLELADVRALSDADDTYDCVVSIWLPNGIDRRGLEDLLAELRRVSKRYLIVGIRHKVPVAELLREGPGGLQRWVTGRLLAFRRLLGPPRDSDPHAVHHRRDVVLLMFRALRLRIEARIVVEQGRDGTDHTFYLLTKDRS